MRMRMGTKSQCHKITQNSFNAEKNDHRGQLKLFTAAAAVGSKKKARMHHHHQ